MYTQLYLENNFVSSELGTILRNLRLILNRFLVNKNMILDYPIMNQSYFFFRLVDNILNNFYLLKIRPFFWDFKQYICPFSQRLTLINESESNNTSNLPEPARQNIDNIH